jgi:peptide/nickel transport system ATP-binding protein
MNEMPDNCLVSLNDIQVHFPVKKNWLGHVKSTAHVLNGINLQANAGETLGIVGESGCGKSTLAQVLMGLLPPTRGTVTWHTGSGKPNIQIVFQDPQSSLDPRLPVWKVITEPIHIQGGHSRAQLRQIAADLAVQVGLREEYMDRYPHEFSGGQRQRIAIARALAPNPDIIVLDEPTSALDISVQAQILNLLNDLQKARNLSYILISHNVSVIKHMSKRIAVMYLGQIVELGPTSEVLQKPAHPYTELLLDAVPDMAGSQTMAGSIDLPELPGNRHLPSGCFFYDRCHYRDEEGCHLAQPLRCLGAEQAIRWVRCYKNIYENSIRAESTESGIQ